MSMNNSNLQKRQGEITQLVQLETFSQRSDLHNRNSELTLRTVASIALAGAFMPFAIGAATSFTGDVLLIVQISMAAFFGLAALYPRRGIENNIAALESEMSTHTGLISRIYVSRVYEVLQSDKSILKSRNNFSRFSMLFLSSSLFTFMIIILIGG